MRVAIAAGRGSQGADRVSKGPIRRRSERKVALERSLARASWQKRSTASGSSTASRSSGRPWEVAQEVSRRRMRRQRASTGRRPRPSSFAISATNHSTGVSCPSGSLGCWAEPAGLFGGCLPRRAVARLGDAVHGRLLGSWLTSGDYRRELANHLYPVAVSVRSS